MAQQVVNIGTNPNDGTGESLRSAVSKLNTNFTEVYALQSQTINAGSVDYDFTGATIEQRIALADADAVLRGFGTLYIPAFMLPYDITQCPATATIRRIREGGDSSIFDILAYGADESGALDSYAAIAAAIAGAEVSGGIVHGPTGNYAVSATPLTRVEGVVFDFAGAIVPFGSFAGPLLQINGLKLASEIWQPKIDIRRLRIDGQDQASGLVLQRIDHALTSNVVIENCLGTGLLVQQVRESDFFNITLQRCDGNGAPNCYLYEPSSGFADPNNGQRWFGLTVAYCADQALVIDTDVAGGFARGMDFYGAQLHYLDDSSTVPTFPFSNVLNVVELKKCRDLVFIRSNFRTGATSNGTSLKLGDSASSKQLTNCSFYGCTITGEGATATGINGSSLSNVEFTHCRNGMTNGTLLTGSSPQWSAPRRSNTATYSASITVDASAGDSFAITATDANAFTINAPTNPFQGMFLTFYIRNSSGGAMGTITWNATLHLAGAFTNPANGARRTITFARMDGAWWEVGRAGADMT